MGCLCSFLHWASQVQTCLILMSLPIPIKRLSESLFASLCQSLSLWSSSTPAPNIWLVDKTSSRVSAWHSRMEMTMAMQRWCLKNVFWSIHTCCDRSIQAYWRGTLVIIYYFGYFWQPPKKPTVIQSSGIHYLKCKEKEIFVIKTVKDLIQILPH